LYIVAKIEVFEIFKDCFGLHVKKIMWKVKSLALTLFVPVDVDDATIRTEVTFEKSFERRFYS